MYNIPQDSRGAGHPEDSLHCRGKRETLEGFKGRTGAHSGGGRHLQWPILVCEASDGTGRVSAIYLHIHTAILTPDGRSG
jgi:hypothetical protein